MRRRISIKRLREVLAFDPVTGDLTWKVSPNRKIKVGDRAGTTNREDSVEVRVDGHKMRAHRVILAMVTGRWPPKLVDHEDGNGTNNKWENLRKASGSQNQANKKMQKNNRIGLKGVSRNRQGFMARIVVEGQRIHLGTHPTPEAAHAAYVAKARELFGEFARSA